MLCCRSYPDFFMSPHQDPVESTDESSLEKIAPKRGRFRSMLFGAPRDINDPSMFHSISLIPFLAWVGLGVDGLSSCAYGPDESFRALFNLPTTGATIRSWRCCWRSRRRLRWRSSRGRTPG